MRDGPVGELHWMSVAEAAQAIADKELSPVELMQALLERIDTLDPRLNAFIRLDGEAAMAAAQGGRGRGRRRSPARAAARRAGRHQGHHRRRRPADDLPFQDPRRTTSPTADAVCVQKLRGAGAIVMGKLSTHEFAIGGPSFDLPWPPARNPWNPDHHPGGSSSGSGAGVAAGPVPDGAGHRHRRQRAQSRELLRHRRAEADLRPGVAPRRLPAVLHARPYRPDDAHRRRQRADAGGDRRPRPARSRQRRRRRTATMPRSLDRGVRGLRIGFVRHFHEIDMPAEPEVTAALNHVARALQMEGAEVRDIRLPTLAEFGAVNRVILQSEAWAIHGPWLRERPGDYGQLARRRLMAGAFLARRRLRAGAAPAAGDDRRGRGGACARSTCCCAPARWTRPAASTGRPTSSAPIRARRARRSTSPAIRRSP